MISQRDEEEGSKTGIEIFEIVGQPKLLVNTGDESKEFQSLTGNITDKLIIRKIMCENEPQIMY